MRYEEKKNEGKYDIENLDTKIEDITVCQHKSYFLSLYG